MTGSCPQEHESLPCAVDTHPAVLAFCKPFYKMFLPGGCGGIVPDKHTSETSCATGKQFF